MCDYEGLHLVQGRDEGVLQGFAEFEALGHEDGLPGS